jgi:hypothetical protein
MCCSSTALTKNRRSSLLHEAALAFASWAKSSQYEDRFDANRYAQDEPVGVFVGADDPDAVWVPERLFHRLVAVAQCYELHLLLLLGGADPVQLNRQQIEVLLEELAHVAECLPNDQLVREQASRLGRYLRSVLARPDSISISVTVAGG